MTLPDSGTMSQSENVARLQGLRAMVRAMISGYVDSYALLNFGVYASFMSGNTTSAGADAGQARFAAAAHSFLPIPFFVLGIFVGTLMVRAAHPQDFRRLSGMVATLLALACAAALFAWPGWLGIMLLSIAMGILNLTITHVGSQSVSLGFVTGDLNNLAQHLATGVGGQPVPQQQGSWDTHWRRAALLASVWTAFFVGAVLGGTLSSRLAPWALLPPVAVLLVLILLERD